ncbi:hypothetical protein BGZ46_002679 [Entomortierella lignicola]|nr:hypothetical protein BGZ46_002679 [Entomortierella lignicola]
MKLTIQANMVQFSLEIVFVIILSLVLETTYASFGYCIALKGPFAYGREVVGLIFWESHGAELEQYQVLNSVDEATFTIQNWTIKMTFINTETLLLDEVNVTNPI